MANVVLPAHSRTLRSGDPAPPRSSPLGKTPQAAHDHAHVMNLNTLQSKVKPMVSLYVAAI